MKNKIIEAIKKINVDAEFSVSGEDINSIVWENGTTPISIEDIQAQISNVETEIAQEKTDRTNAINKLKGATYSALTDAEAKALFGE